MNLKKLQDAIPSMVNGKAINDNAPLPNPLHLIHFNDVYNVEPQATEPVGGAARFKTAVCKFQDRHPLILFSGDIFAPSIMSSTTHGDQMIPVLNQLDVHYSVFGNHDFDFGLERLMELSKKTKCPWLMSNVVDKETNRPLAEGEISIVVKWDGWKVGLMGLVEEEWLETLSTINVDEVIYTDYVEKGIELSTNLRNQGCDFIIALTHMRTPNDRRLAEKVDGIDLILGGHDHVYEDIKVNGTTILKSGTDFREFSALTIKQDKTFNFDVDIQRVEVTSQYEPDEMLENALKEYEGLVQAKMDEELGTFSVDLDGKFSNIRTSETNLGNFICDILMAACNADVCVLNSGTFRSDKIHPAGKFYMKDLMNVLPMLDSMVVVEVTGKILIEVLENGVSQYPKLEGRFPQVAGIQYIFNPNLPAGSRVCREFIKVGDEFLQENLTYRLVTKAYLQSGRDGYQMLKNCPLLQDEEQSPMMSTAVQNHFSAIRTRLGKTRRASTHRQSLLLLSRRHSLIRYDDDQFLTPGAIASTSKAENKPVGSDRHSLPHPPSNYTPAVARSLSCTDSVLRSQRSSGTRKLSRQDSCQELELEACKLAPKNEKRINVWSKEIVKEFEKEKELMLVARHDVPIIPETDE